MMRLFSIYVELAPDPESDCDVTIPVSDLYVVFRLIQMPQTRSWSRFYRIRGWGNSNIRKEMEYHSHMT